MKTGAQCTGPKEINLVAKRTAKEGKIKISSVHTLSGCKALKEIGYWGYLALECGIPGRVEQELPR